MKTLTINQALDLILTNYKSKNKPTKIATLQERLILMKLEFGGNTQVENADEVLEIISPKKK